MIDRVRIRGFKRFDDITFRLPGHVVLAGPNNTGKTTVLQAIASWALALRRWRERNDFTRRRGYARTPITRESFFTAPLRSFDLLWKDRRHRAPIDIELRHTDGWAVTMHFLRESAEQIYVRPAADTPASTLRSLDLRAIFVPPMAGVGIDEPVFQPAKIDQLLGLGRAGEVLRNLLADAHQHAAAWTALQASIAKLFDYQLLPPDARGAHIRAEYTMRPDGPRLDIANAGSGVQQVLMLLAFLHTRPDAVLLLDEPDAHLHLMLQDAIYYELRAAAARQRSQLIVATHSEVVIDAVEPREMYVMLDTPRAIADTADRSRLVTALRVLSNADVMQVMTVRGVLYVEDYTDIDILRALAARLRHRAAELLSTGIMWKPAVFHARAGRPGIRARAHFSALQLVREDVRGLELLDGDAHPNIRETGGAPGSGLQRLRWRRYEIESYLVHPDALARFVEAAFDANAAAAHIKNLREHWRNDFPPRVVNNPLEEHTYLETTKARTKILPQLLTAAGLPALPYTRYHEIAALMEPGEIHPEIVEKLDAICRIFEVKP